MNERDFTLDDIRNVVRSEIGDIRNIVRSEIDDALKDYPTKEHLDNGIEQLAIMTQHGFIDMEGRIDKVANQISEFRNEQMERGENLEGKILKLEEENKEIKSELKMRAV